jgi:hypothetical protein
MIFELLIWVLATGWCVGMAKVLEKKDLGLSMFWWCMATLCGVCLALKLAQLI